MFVGHPKHLRKQYEKPKKLFDKERIEREKKLKEEFGLKNAREIWKANTELRKIRREARRLLSKKGKNIAERTEKLVNRVKRYLLRKNDVTLDDILVLDVRGLLERRLQTIVQKKHMAKTVTQARQFISHGHVAIAGNRVSIPSYVVKFDEEALVSWYGKPVQTELPSETAKKPAEKPAQATAEPAIAATAASGDSQ